MKKLILLLFISVTFLGYSQTLIQQFDSAPASKYYVVTSSTDIENPPSASGANVTWTFNSFSATGTTTQDTYAGPTSGELTTYPNTTSVQTTIITPSSDGENKIFTENIAGLTSFTGIERTGLSLNYNGNNSNNSSPISPLDMNGNAVIGVFPFAFGGGSSDDVSGSFIFESEDFGILNGLFEGIITTSFDAYGTLNTNALGGSNGSAAYSGQVTRLKIEQHLVFNQLNAVADQLSYYYYDSATGNLFMRYNKFVIYQSSGSAFDPIEDVFIERLDTSTLSVGGNSLDDNAFNIYPNPVKNTLNFSLGNDSKIQSFIVSDITGRQVLNVENKTNSFDASPFKSGIYILSVKTNKGLVSRKFVKE